MPNQNDKKSDPVNWLTEFGDYLYAFALSKVYNAEAAEDLVQECLLSAWKAKDGFQGKSSVKTWLTSILRRKIIDHYRSSGRTKEVSWEDFSNPYSEDLNNKGQWIESRIPQTWGDTPVSNMETSEFMLVLQDCLSDLPEKWKSAITLKSFEDLSTAEICKELNVTTSNLWVLIHRAKLKLRECLEDNWFKETPQNE